ncbi:MAG: hypothetical protein H0X30_06470 [Anaerolineae bacterium]|nr:hypothetical protein [Anaerolineae bacterium]
MRFAVLSNIIPPTPYGQSIVLYRLLNNVPPDQYYLITDESQISSTVASAELPATTYRIGLPPRRQWASPLDMVKRAYRRLHGRSGEMENFIHLRARQISEVIQRDPCCALVVATGDLVSMPAAAIACAENGVPFIPYIFDDYAYHMVDWTREMAIRLMQPMMTQAAEVIVTNEATDTEYRRRYHISNTTVIHNAAPILDLDSIRNPNPVLDKSTFNIVYSGAVYHAHYDAFRNMIQAIETLPKNTVKLHLFTDQSAESIASKGISGDCLVHHGHVNQSMIAATLLEADLLFLPLAFDAPTQEVLRLASPGKMGDYLGMAKPILVHAPADCYIAQYFRQHDCGVVVDKPDVALLAQTISDIVAGKIDTERLAHNARQQAEIDFATEHVQAQFMALMQKVCQPA